MTTGTSRKPPTALRDWALAELELQPGVSNDEARRIICRRLSEVDFMPPRAWDSALRMAGIAPSDGAVNGPVSVPARRAVEEALRAEVEAFAAKIFSLPPHIRTAQYQELLKQAAGMPAVTARLEGLCPALELPCELPTGQRPEVVELLDQVRRLFVLPRQERASRRLAFLQQCRTNWPQWQRVAIAVQAKIARLPSLEPELFRELCTSGNREKVRQKIARQRRRSSQKSRGPHTTTRNSSGNRWWMAIIVGVGLAIIRGSTSSHNPSPKPPLVPSSSPWTAQERERHRELGRSLVEIQNRLKQREAERAARPGQLPRNPAESLLPPPEKTSSPPPNPSLPPLPSGGVEIRIVKSPEEAQEMLRQLQEQQAQGGQQKGMPRVEMHNLNLDQAREFLRQLREQQAQGGPNTSRDAAIRALEQVLDEAGRNSQE